MQIVVVMVAAGCGVIAFLIYLAISLNVLKSDEQEKAKEGATEAVRSLRAVDVPTPAEVAELIKALATLSDSLVKAGPALWSLLGSILFLLIAAIAAGLLGGAPASDPAGNTAAPTGVSANAVGKSPNTALPPEENLPVPQKR